MSDTECEKRFEIRDDGCLWELIEKLPDGLRWKPVLTAGQLRSLTAPLPEDSQNILERATHQWEAIRDSKGTAAFFIDRIPEALTLLSTTLRRNQELEADKKNRECVVFDFPCAKGKTHEHGKGCLYCALEELERENAELVKRCEKLEKWFNDLKKEQLP